MRKRYTLPCIHEGNILEWCHTCNGEKRHVRECTHYDDKCTRGQVSHLVRSCFTCAKQSNTPYIPDKEFAVTDNRGNEKLHPEGKTSQHNAIVQTIAPISVRENRLRIRAELLKQRRQSIERDKAQQNIGTGEPQVNPIPQRIPPKRLVAKRTHSIDKSQIIVWEYGITTVEERLGKELDTTIISLRNAGFDKPRLFVDGSYALASYKQTYNLDVTVRSTKVKTLGNWLMGMLELYLRNPHADRYAIFQDDIVCCKDLRIYLEKCEYPDKGYLNLITYPQNEGVKTKYFTGIAPNSMVGWYPSNQMGKGAQGLVFNREGLLVLLTHRYIIERVQDLDRGWRSIDGAIVTAMKRSGYTEYVHSPSLIRHIGEKSTMGNQEQPSDVSFQGENWSALEMLKEGTT